MAFGHGRLQAEQVPIRFASSSSILYMYCVWGGGGLRVCGCGCVWVCGCVGVYAHASTYGDTVEMRYELRKVLNFFFCAF